MASSVIVNDFVVKFANVNGTGSASANYLFAKAIFRMGIPVTAKNIFPSNIQGLPTWYEVRVSDKAYYGRREGIDVMVCVNPQSMMQDVKSVKTGGYFIYDNTKKLHPSFVREDINYIGIPLMEMCNREYTDPRQRQLFKNIIYVGALTELLHIEFNVYEDLFADQFKGKEKLIAPNIQALQLGINYIKENFNHTFPFTTERREYTKNKIMVDGNTACGLGAIYGGATVAAWYPITPSTSVVEAFEKYAKKYRVDPETGKNKYAIVQAEDELAALGMVIGATWNGARAFTATSGPGVSLMNEFLGLAYFAEIPAVLIDVQRTGPSTGMPTRTQQSDILISAYASHGDTKHVLLFPSTPKECFELTAAAFDLSEQLQTPIILLTDLDLGMNDHVSDPFEWDDDRKYDRGKVYHAEDLEKIEKFGRYLDIDGDGIPYRTYPGAHPKKGAFFTRGTSHNEYAGYTEDGADYTRNVERLLVKFETAKKLVPKPDFYQKSNKSDEAMLFFGTSMYPAEEALDVLKENGIELDAVRIKAFPFNDDIVEFINAHEKVYVIEQNRDAQLKTLLVTEHGFDPAKLVSILNYDGMPMTAEQISKAILEKSKSTIAKTVNN